MKKLFRSLQMVPLVFCPSVDCSTRNGTVRFEGKKSWLQLSPSICQRMGILPLGEPSENLWYSVAIDLEGGTSREGRRRYKRNVDQVRFEVVDVTEPPETCVVLAPEIGSRCGCSGRLEVPLKSLPGKFCGALPWLLQNDAPFRMTGVRVTSLSVLTERAARYLEQVERGAGVPA